MSSVSLPNDPNRPDAVLVYRHLQKHPGSSSEEIARACFPVAVEGPDSTLKVIARRSLARVYDAIGWMRGQGVRISAVPVYDMPTRFFIGERPDVISPIRASSAPVTGNLSRHRATLPAESAEVAKAGDAMEIMDIWHVG